MTTDERPTTWLEVAIRNGGLRKASKAMMWACTWAIVRDEVGHDPSAEEVADWWDEPKRTVYREQAAFRACFPTLDTPAPIYASAQALDSVRKTFVLDDAPNTEHLTKGRSPDDAVLALGMLPASPEAIP